MNELIGQPKPENISLRQFYAGLAMHAFVSANADNEEELDVERVVFDSVNIADTLIQLLKETNGNH